MQALFQKQTSQARNIHHYNYSKELERQMGVDGLLFSQKLKFFLKNGDKLVGVFLITFS